MAWSELARFVQRSFAKNGLIELKKACEGNSEEEILHLIPLSDNEVTGYVTPYNKCYKPCFKCHVVLHKIFVWLST